MKAVKILLFMISLLFLRTIEGLPEEEIYDPFLVPEEYSSSDSLVLKGIIWDKDKPLALINEEVVGEGQTICGITVKKIEENRVILYKNNSTQESILSLEETNPQE